jgi:hypothetical protein
VDGILREGKRRGQNYPINTGKESRRVGPPRLAPARHMGEVSGNKKLHYQKIRRKDQEMVLFPIVATSY